MKPSHAIRSWPAGVMLIGMLALPLSRQALEAHMVTHMLVQIPLLAIAGMLLAPAVASRLQLTLERYNQHGLPGMLMVWFASSYWMLPRALDAAVANPGNELIKFCSLPLVVGLPLALSWHPAGPVGRGFVLANAISMIAVAGWLYRQSPVRLCNYYLIDQQVLVGDGLLALALLLGLGCAARAFIGSPSRPRVLDCPRAGAKVRIV